MARLRDFGLTIGSLDTGPHNAITDVGGVAVGHATMIADEPNVIRTGVTIVATRPAEAWGIGCYGGLYSFNGNGEMTGSHWLEESGVLAGPIGITNTHQVGMVRDALVAAEVVRDPDATWCLPIVGETYDGFLNDIDSFALTPDHVTEALENLRSGPVDEGCVGGGTGMICHGFKGGSGTSSRVVATAGEQYTVGAIVQANYGGRHHLRLDGELIGDQLGPDVVPMPTDPSIADSGSIIVILATDAPLLADQCKRLARRATVGLARVGGFGSNGSGDIFLAFSTANAIPIDAATPMSVQTLPADQMSPLFEAAAEATEEAIWNALCAAETTTGFRGRTVHAMPHGFLTEYEVRKRRTPSAPGAPSA